MSTSTSASSSALRHASTPNSTVHTAVAEDVQVKSIVSTETHRDTTIKNHKQLNDLLGKLSSTHSQIDDYSKKQIDKISDRTRQAVDRIVAETKQLQESLLRDANARAAEIEKEYKIKLEVYLQELDTAKAQNLAVLEKDLVLRQESILVNAKNRIDELNSEANRVKMNLLKEAQLESSVRIGNITEQVAAIGMHDTQKSLQSTTTTVITTNTNTKSEVHVRGDEVLKSGVHTGTEPRTSAKP